MNMIAIIEKKKNGQVLSKDEIKEAAEILIKYSGYIEREKLRCDSSAADVTRYVQRTACKSDPARVRSFKARCGRKI